MLIFFVIIVNVTALRHSDTHIHEQKSETSKWCVMKGFRIKCIVKGLFVSERKGTVRDISQEDVQEGPASAKWSSELPIIDFNRVKRATNNFSEADKLGEGGFGAVYKVIKLLNKYLHIDISLGMDRTYE